MNETLAELAQKLQKQSSIYIPMAYTLGRSKVLKRYNINRPWSQNDQVNIEMLLNRHASELAKSFSKIEERMAAGESLPDLLDGLLARLSLWSWVLHPALASGMAAGVDASRGDIAREENISTEDIGIIWYVEDNTACKQCLYLAGRWFDAKEAYDIAAKIHPNCFPKGTNIATQTGNKTIESVKVGDKVWTRKGLRTVTNIMKRSYSGKMRSIRAGRKHLIATYEHPVWTSNKGWLEIGAIKVGDTLQMLDNKFVQVSDINDYVIGNSNHVPSHTIEESRFPGISGRVSMPINTINLKSDSMIRDSKINRIPSYLRFLHKWQIKVYQAFSNSLFGASLKFRTTVTRKRAEAPDSRIFSPYGRFSPKYFTALFAGQPLSAISPASLATNCVTVSNTSLNSEGFATYRADFSNIFGGCKLAGSRTIFGIDPSSHAVKRLSTKSAINKFPFSFSYMFTFVRAVNLITESLTRHFKRLAALSTTVMIHMSKLYHSYHTKSIEVYNLEVEGEHEYYANGILVHNCRCPPNFDVGTPDEAIVAPIPGYKPGTAEDVYKDLNIAGLAQARISKARRIIARGKPALGARMPVNI